MSRRRCQAEASGLQTAPSTRATVRAAGSHPSADLPHGSVLRSLMLCWPARRSNQTVIDYTFEPTVQVTAVCGGAFDWSTHHGHMADSIWAKQAVRRTACYHGRWRVLVQGRLDRQASGAGTSVHAVRLEHRGLHPSPINTA